MRDSGTNNLIIALTGVGFLVILVIMVAWLRTYFFDVRNEVEYRTVLSVDNPKLLAIQKRDAEILTTYGWMDKDKGIVRIPIERAMELTVERAQGGGGGE